MDFKNSLLYEKVLKIICLHYDQLSRSIFVKTYSYLTATFLYVGVSFFDGCLGSFFTIYLNDCSKKKQAQEARLVV